MIYPIPKSWLYKKNIYRNQKREKEIYAALTEENRTAEDLAAEFTKALNEAR